MRTIYKLTQPADCEGRNTWTVGYFENEALARDIGRTEYGSQAMGPSPGSVTPLQVHRRRGHRRPPNPPETGTGQTHPRGTQSTRGRPMTRTAANYLAGDIAVLAFQAGALFGTGIAWNTPEHAPATLTLFGLLFLITAIGTSARYHMARTREQDRDSDLRSAVSRYRSAGEHDAFQRAEAMAAAAESILVARDKQGARS